MERTRPTWTAAAESEPLWCPDWFQMTGTWSKHESKRNTGSYYLQKSTITRCWVGSVFVDGCGVYCPGRLLPLDADRCDMSISSSFVVIQLTPVHEDCPIAPLPGPLWSYPEDIWGELVKDWVRPEVPGQSWFHISHLIPFACLQLMMLPPPVSTTLTTAKPLLPPRTPSVPQIINSAEETSLDPLEENSTSTCLMSVWFQDWHRRVLSPTTISHPSCEHAPSVPSSTNQADLSASFMSLSLSDLSQRPLPPHLIHPLSFQPPPW